MSMRRLRAIALFVLLGSVLVFAVQNATMVDIRFLLWSFSLPRVLLIVFLLAVGFALGVLIAGLGGAKRR